MLSKFHAMDARDLSNANKMTRIQGEQDNNNFFYGFMLAYHPGPVNASKVLIVPS